MINSSSAFRDKMVSPILKTYIKMELLDKHERVIDIFETHVTSDDMGDISVDVDRDIRRTFTLSLDNSEGRFTWNEGGLIWIDNKRIKLYTGIEVNGEVEYIPQGVFVVTQPEATHKPHMNLVSISGQDKAYLLTGNFGRFTHELTVNKGTNIREAVKIIAQNGGIERMILDSCDITVPYDMTFQIGQNRWKAIKDLTAKAYSDGEYFYDVFFDVNGYLRFTKYRDPLLESPVWTYKVEDNTLYAGSVRKLDDSNLFNHILVMGGNSNTAEFRSELIIDETVAEWEGHPYSIQKIGDRFFAYNNGNPDPIIDTQSQCDARAKFELKNKVAFAEHVSFDLAPNYLHEGNDVIEIVDDKNGCTGRYQLKSFSIPIKPKIISASATRIREGIE